jgi:hypothetical protein
MTAPFNYYLIKRRLESQWPGRWGRRSGRRTRPVDNLEQDEALIAENDERVTYTLQDQMIPSDVVVGGGAANTLLSRTWHIRSSSTQKSTRLEHT